MVRKLLLSSAVLAALGFSLPAAAQPQDLQDAFRMPERNRLASEIAARLPGWLPIDPVKMMSRRKAKQGTAAYSNFFSLPVVKTQLSGTMPFEFGLGLANSAQDRQRPGWGERQGLLERCAYDVYVSLTW